MYLVGWECFPMLVPQTLCVQVTQISSKSTVKSLCITHPPNYNDYTANQEPRIGAQFNEPHLHLVGSTPMAEPWWVGSPKGYHNHSPLSLSTRTLLSTISISQPNFLPCS